MGPDDGDGGVGDDEAVERAEDGRVGRAKPVSGGSHPRRLYNLTN
jgi:hypothetical protein